MQQRAGLRLSYHVSVKRCTQAASPTAALRSGCVINEAMNNTRVRVAAKCKCAMRRLFYHYGPSTAFIKLLHKLPIASRMLSPRAHHSQRGVLDDTHNVVSAIKSEQTSAKPEWNIG
eukprot:1337588-Amphidinium_carterae.2